MGGGDTYVVILNMVLLVSISSCFGREDKILHMHEKEHTNSITVQWSWLHTACQCMYLEGT